MNLVASSWWDPHTKGQWKDLPILTDRNHAFLIKLSIYLLRTFQELTKCTNLEYSHICCFVIRFAMLQRHWKPSLEYVAVTEETTVDFIYQNRKCISLKSYATWYGRGWFLTVLNHLKPNQEKVHTRKPTRMGNSNLSLIKVHHNLHNKERHIDLHIPSTQKVAFHFWQIQRLLLHFISYYSIKLHGVDFDCNIYLQYTDWYFLSHPGHIGTFYINQNILRHIRLDTIPLILAVQKKKFLTFIQPLNPCYSGQ